MSETDRDDSGRFTESVTEQDILKAFDRADAPFLTASELGEELGLSRQAANYRLKKMRENGLVDRKQTGARSVGWWAEVAPRLSPEARRRADAAERENAVSQDEMKRRLGMDEGVIEEFSHRDHGTSRIVSTYVVGDFDDEAETQSKEHLRSCVDAASGVRSPDAAVLDRVVGSFDASPAVVRLVQR